MKNSDFHINAFGYEAVGLNANSDAFVEVLDILDDTLFEISAIPRGCIRTSCLTEPKYFLRPTISNATSYGIALRIL